MYIYAIELYFNDTLEEKVIGIWKSLAQSGITTSMLDITCVNPHISLAVFQDYNSDNVIPSIRSFATHTDCIPVTFSSIGAFHNAAFLGCTVTNALLELHSRFYRECCSNIPLDHWWDLYRPGKWIPHCTVAIKEPKNIIAAAIAHCIEIDLPLEGELERIELVKVAIPDDHVSSCSPVISLPFKKGSPSAR